MKIVLRTERLILREFTEDDADLLLVLDSDPEVLRYVGGQPLGDRDAYRERIRTIYLPYYARYPSYGYWAAHEEASGDFLGWFHLRPALHYRFAAEAGYQPGDVDLGYRLRQSVWGRGYATEVARALVCRALTELEATCVVATALVGNRASTRVMEKAGLKRIGEYTLPGYAMPAVKYALRREEFQPPG